MAKYDLPNNQISNWTRYNELFLKGASRTSSESSEFSSLQTTLSNYLITANDWNTLESDLADTDEIAKQGGYFGTASGTSAKYIISLSLPILYGTIPNGTRVHFKAPANNNTPMYLSTDGDATNYKIKYSIGGESYSELLQSMILQGDMVTVEWYNTGACWILISPLRDNRIDYATMGSILYAYSNNIPAELVPNGAGKVLTMNDSNVAPEWKEQPKSNILDLEYYYAHNTKTIFPENKTFTSGAGMQSYDTVNVKVGTQALKIEENDNTPTYLFSYSTISSINLSVFLDGSASSTNDLISIPIYIDDISMVDTGAVDAIEIIMSTDVGTTNYFRFRKNTNLQTGWNKVFFKKSDAAQIGNPDWTDIQLVAFAWVSASSAMGAYVTFDSNAMHLCRVDPSYSTIGNPFQKLINNTNVAEYIIKDTTNASYWFLGKENKFNTQDGQIICKDLMPIMTPATTMFDPTLKGVKTYSDNFIIGAKFRNNTDNHSGTIGWFIDSLNYVVAFIDSNVLILQEIYNGAETSSTTALINIYDTDVIELYFEKSGSTFTATVYKNNQRHTPYSTNLYSGFFSEEGYLCFGGSFTANDNVSIENLTITNLKNANHANTASSLKNFTETWIPALYWSASATPVINNDLSVYDYTTIGSRCVGDVYIYASDGGGMTALDIPLPIAPARRNTSNWVVASGIQVVDSAPTNPLAFVSPSTQSINFWNFSTATSGKQLTLVIHFDYEI